MVVTLASLVKGRGTIAMVVGFTFISTFESLHCDYGAPLSFNTVISHGGRYIGQGRPFAISANAATRSAIFGYFSAVCGEVNESAGFCAAARSCPISAQVAS